MDLHGLDLATDMLLFSPGMSGKAIVQFCAVAAVAVGGVLVYNHWQNQHRLQQAKKDHDPNSPNPFQRA